MKELEAHDKDKQEIKAEKRQIEAIFLDSDRYIPGLKLWSYNLETSELLEVIPERPKGYIVGGDNNRKIVEPKKNHMYVQALNKETAENQFYKMLGEMLGRPKGPRLHPKKKKRK